MNIKLETRELSLHLEYVEQHMIEHVMLSFFEHLDGRSFVETYKQLSEDRLNSKQFTIDEKARLNREKQLRENEERRKKKSVKTDQYGVRTYEDGREEYKCFYTCTCGHTGVRYIEDIDSPVECHECKTQLSAMPATIDALHDSDFNYFVAY